MICEIFIYSNWDGNTLFHVEIKSEIIVSIYFRFLFEFILLPAFMTVQIYIVSQIVFNPFRTKTPNIYSQDEINLYCIIKLAT